MENYSEDVFDNLISGMKDLNQKTITLLSHYFGKIDTSSKYFEHFKTLSTWLENEFSQHIQDFSDYDIIECYLRIMEVLQQLSDFESNINKKIKCLKQFFCPKCGNLLKVGADENILNKLQTHKYYCKIIDEETSNNHDDSSNSSASSAAVDDVLTLHSEEDIEDSSVNSHQELLKLNEANGPFTKCVQHEENVRYTEIAHLPKKEYLLPSDLLGKPQKKIIRYDISVQAVLYTAGIADHTVKISDYEYYFIQNFVAYKYCMACIENLTDVTKHVNSQTHLEIINKKAVLKALKKYHDLWLFQPPHNQIQQRYFKTYNVGMICVLCSNIVNFTSNELKQHLESLQHKLFVLKNTSVNGEQFNNCESDSISSFNTAKELKKNKFEKAISDCVLFMINKCKHEGRHDMYPSIITNHVYAYDRCNLFTVQLKSNRVLRCLLCNTEFSFDHVNVLFIHVRGKKHLQLSVINSRGYIALNSYHNFWKEVDIIYRDMQEDFWPITETVSWCIKCGINLEYKHLHKHLQMFHNKSTKDADVSKLVHNDFRQLKFCFYNKKIMEYIYPDNITQFNVIRDKKAYPLIQTLGGHRKCILCKCLLKEDVLKHLTSQTHIKNANNSKCCQEVKMFHDFWNGKNCQLEQMQQVYFFPKRQKFECVICGGIFKPKQMLDHIRSNQHKLLTSKYPLVHTYSSENLVQDTPLLSGATGSVVTKADSLVAGIASNGGAKMHTQSTGTATQRIGSTNIQKPSGTNANNSNINVVATSYDTEVENILYPNSLTKLVEMFSDCKILTLRRHTGNRYICLLCYQCEANPKFLNEQDVYPHIIKINHNKNYSNRIMLRTLKAYHKKWIQMPKNLQIMQIDYIPVNETKCRCLRCGMLVAYSELIAHVTNKKHTRKTQTSETSYFSLIESSEKNSPWFTIIKKLNSNENDLMIQTNEVSNEENNEVSQLSDSPEVGSYSSDDDDDNDDYDDEDDDDSDDGTCLSEESDGNVSFRDITESDYSETNSQSDSINVSQQTKQNDNIIEFKFEMKYDKSVEETLFPHVQNYVEIDNARFPIFRNTIDGGIICLLCPGNPNVQSIKRHSTSNPNHVKQMNNADQLSKLKRFHVFWMNQEISAQLLQKYFKILSDDWQLKCCLCDTVVFYENCIEHVNMFHNISSKYCNKSSKNQVSEIENEYFDDSISPTPEPSCSNTVNKRPYVPDFNFQFKFELKYDELVEIVLYPDDLKQHFVLIDNIKYPIFRAKGNNCECLLCGANSDLIQQTSVEDHLNTNTHKSKLQEQCVLSRFIAFHNFWMNQEPHLQLEQMCFQIQDEKLTCMLCDSAEMSYDEVLTHIESFQHTKNNISAVNKQEKNDVVSGKSVDVEKQEKTIASSERKKSISSKKQKDAKAFNSASNLDSKFSKSLPTLTDTNSADKKKKQLQPHEIRKAVANPNSSLLLERMPQRYKDHLRFLRIESDDSVSCSCCSVTLRNLLPDLKTHLRTKDHEAKAKVPLMKFKFFCEICIKIYSLEDSWEKHLKDSEHLGVLSNLGKIRKDNMTEHECVTCAVVIFGDKLSLIRHQQWNRKSAKKNKELKLPEGVRRLFESNKHIEEVTLQLVTEADRESLNQEKEKDCCVALVSALKQTYQNCRAYPFGSRVTGLGSKDSDLDVFVDVNNMYKGHKMQSSEEQAEIIMNVKKILKKSKNIFSHINPVPTARTPIIQVFHTVTGIDCDVSFKHGLSVENTAFIRLCIDLQPIVQRVILILKQWFKLCDVNNFSSYALTMMAIFYLQTQGYLLSVKELRAINSSPSKVIDGWETIKYTASLLTMKSYIQTCELSVKDLLHNFFVYYAKYDYEKQVICPLLGHSVLKTAFNENGSNLPPEMISYVQKLKTRADAELFRNRSPMCVQDPFDLSHNLTKACEKGFVTKWKGYCELSAKQLSALH